MLSLKNNSKFLSLLAFSGMLVGATLYGCNSGQNPSAAQGTAPAAQPEAGSFALFGTPPQKTGVQLWSENCSRCHNMRPPNEYNDAQWAVIVHHMRLRANLTGVEAREITKFLQASH
jgi:hypothetical protein